MKKPVFYTEVACVAGLLLLALGTALTAYGNFGISMVVAPAYILHLKIAEYLPFFSFGMAEYLIQALVLAAMMLILRKVRWSDFLSFVTAVLYGLVLDCGSLLTALLPDLLPLRIGLYVLGVCMCTLGIALQFRTYFPPAAYELFIKKLCARFGWQVHRAKTVYDCISCLVAAGLSWLLLGRLEGVGIGTVVCALIYGLLIRLHTRILDRIWVFRDRFPLREKFEESEKIS